MLQKVPDELSLLPKGLDPTIEQIMSRVQGRLGQIKNGIESDGGFMDSWASKAPALPSARKASAHSHAAGEQRLVCRLS